MQLPTLVCYLFIFSSCAMSPPSDAQVPLQSILSPKEASAVPGDSPCRHVGDPSNDLLAIEGLDLVPNPPVDYLTVRLRGNLISNIGLKPTLKMTAALNGTIGPSSESEMCFDYQQSRLEITQNGTSVCPPKKGPVEMSYDVIIAYWWLKKGNYTVHVQMNATDGARMTDFEGTVWVHGEADGGEGGGWV